MFISSRLVHAEIWRTCFSSPSFKWARVKGRLCKSVWTEVETRTLFSFQLTCYGDGSLSWHNGNLQWCIIKCWLFARPFDDDYIKRNIVNWFMIVIYNVHTWRELITQLLQHSFFPYAMHLSLFFQTLMSFNEKWEIKIVLCLIWFAWPGCHERENGARRGNWCGVVELQKNSQFPVAHVSVDWSKLECTSEGFPFPYYISLFFSLYALFVIYSQQI